MTFVHVPRRLCRAQPDSNCVKVRSELDESIVYDCLPRPRWGQWSSRR